MTSRDTNLQRVRQETSKIKQVPLPATPEVWPEKKPSAAAMAEQFTTELTAVSGEVIPCATMQDARRRLTELMVKSKWFTLGVMDCPAVHEVVSDLPQIALRWEMTDWTSHQFAELSASVIAPEALLADTGSCVVACPTAANRMLCYIPPACVVIARRSQLAEHLPSAWKTLAPRVADPSMRGEFVIVTGPSRTADIEKILILGVHGPNGLSYYWWKNSPGKYVFPPPRRPSRLRHKHGNLLSAFFAWMTYPCVCNTNAAIRRNSIMPSRLCVGVLAVMR